MSGPRWTQLEAFDIVAPKLPKKREEVFRVFHIFTNGLAMFDIAIYLEVPINEVTGRVNELEKANLIKNSGRVAVNPRTNKRCIIWELKPRR